MMGCLVAFRGFDVNNPQHLGWLKRKLRNRDRYERRQRNRRLSGTKTDLPRHLQSRRPNHSRWWNWPAVHVNAITGMRQRASYTRREFFNSLSPADQHTLRIRFGGPPNE